jgi:small subunit ribosomal protein S27Ae
VSKEAKIYVLYEVDQNGIIKRKNRKCPKCGSFMAHHLKPVERWHCGKCNYTEFVTQARKAVK